MLLYTQDAGKVKHTPLWAWPVSAGQEGARNRGGQDRVPTGREELCAALGAAEPSAHGWGLGNASCADLTPFLTPPCPQLLPWRARPRETASTQVLVCGAAVGRRAKKVLVLRQSGWKAVLGCQGPTHGERSPKATTTTLPPRPARPSLSPPASPPPSL